MEPNPIPTSAPSILLLNEIDILLAQMRLMELYLKQAQATVANDAARLHQQHQAELTKVRVELTAEQGKAAAQVEDLKSQLADKQHFLDERGRQLDAARAEIAHLSGEVRRLEAAAQRAQDLVVAADAQRQQLQSEIAELAQRIAGERADFERQQLCSAELERSLRQQLSEAQAEFSEVQNRLSRVNDELDGARTEITTLQARFDELKASAQQAETDAAAQLERSHTRFEAEIVQLRDALSERDRRLEQSGAARGELENALNGEIAALRCELEQKQRQLELGDGEWQRAADEIGALQR